MRFAILDVETTGDRPERDEIIQIGLVIVDGLKVEKTYSSFVRPKAPIPAFITALTGITDEMTAKAPMPDEAVNEFLPLLDGAALVAHQAAFDLAFLQKALAEAGYAGFSGRVLDTLDWLRLVYPSMPSYQLTYLTEALGIPHERPHQADSDALATAELWIRCLERLLSLPKVTLKRLELLFSRPENRLEDQAWLIGELLAVKERTDADEDDVQRVYRDFALAVDDWAEQDAEPPQSGRADADFDSYYQEWLRRVSGKMPQYEERPAQERMMKEVAAALRDERHLVIEAGTGTGKSLGYLVPAVHYALASGEKVVVSTHTINLQEQLREKELPLLHELSPAPFRSAVLKGRSHYLCLRKFEGKVNLADYGQTKEEALALAQMIVWLGETVSGDEEELNLGPKGGEVWRQVASDADSCLNRACPWFRKCFYHRARSAAAAADIIITNHSLLFTDIKAEHRILPAYGRLIVDEAHHFEEAASHHLGVELSYPSLTGPLSSLYKDSRTGQLPLLASFLAPSPAGRAGEAAEQIQSLLPELAAVKEMWDELFNALYDRFAARFMAEQNETGAVSVRLRTASQKADWNVIAAMEENLQLKLKPVLRTLDRIVAEGKEEAADYGLESLYADLAGTVKDLHQVSDALRALIAEDDPNMVYWLEASPHFKAKSIRLAAAPIDVSSLLREYFWERKETVVMTSATLTVEKSFQYVKSQFGFSEDDELHDRLQTLQLPSPFRYREQALVLIPRNFPSLKGAGAEGEFVERLVESLRDAAVVTNGKMLVLFTSYKMLKLAHGPLREQLQPYGIQVIGQGVDSGNRSKLTRLFMQAGSAVLLGTSSFWEGVDIPGDALTCLAIVRLPFQPPNHPMVEAKSELLRSRKENPFIKYSVPQAVIRFKQGFGRLVRSEKDRGVVLIYDTRVIDTSYGKHFLYSLPGPKIEHLPCESIPLRMREWLQGPA